VAPSSGLFLTRRGEIYVALTQYVQYKISRKRTLNVKTLTGVRGLSSMHANPDLLWIQALSQLPQQAQCWPHPYILQPNLIELPL
jgi:hypothetical protein